MQPQDFSSRVLRWQAAHGRHDLPWQGTREPYRVWLSEIMLQQTQVATVLDYYPRFLARFPDVRSLAGAGQGEVLALWSGLGYYSRARHLHRCAQVVVQAHAGVFPRSAAELQKLPGIGPSTAAAIAAFCFGERAAILDGNVRRVLARVLGFDADLARAVNERELWTQARELLPSADLAATMPRYTQGLMDLGATVCLARNPRCDACPLADICVARRQGAPERYPVRTRHLTRRTQDWWLLLYLDSAGRCWLAPRPQHGIWAGLHAPPVGGEPPGPDALGPDARVQALPVFTHVLTHRDLRLHPLVIRAGVPPRQARGAWYGSQDWPSLGLPTPIRRLLDALPGFEQLS